MAEKTQDESLLKSAAAEPFEEPKGPTTAEGLFTFESKPVIEDRVKGLHRVDADGQSPPTEHPSDRSDDKDALVKMVKAKMAKPFFKKLSELDAQAAMDEALAVSIMQFRQSKYERELTEDEKADIILKASGERAIKKASRDVLAGLTDHLDRIAQSLEDAGASHLALLVDSASNSIDQYKKTKGA